MSAVYIWCHPLLTILVTRSPTILNYPLQSKSLVYTRKVNIHKQSNHQNHYYMVTIWRIPVFHLKFHRGSLHNEHNHLVSYYTIFIYHFCLLGWAHNKETVTHKTTILQQNVTRSEQETSCLIGMRILRKHVTCSH